MLTPGIRANLPGLWSYLGAIMAKEIPLTRGLVAIVDDEDFEELNLHKWYAMKMYDRYYARRNVVIGNKKSYFLMHRFIIKAKVNQLVDHKNNNSLDNRKENLRTCSHSENMRNSKKRKQNTSGYKGVYFEKNKNIYSAEVKFGGKRVYRKRFKTGIEAAKAYNEAALKYHGEFALLNTI